MQRRGSVILFFDEPLAPDSVNGGITLFADNQEVADIRTQLDGTALAVQPDGGLKHGVEYVLQIDGLADISGNEAMVESLTFSLPEIDDGSGTVPEQPHRTDNLPGLSMCHSGS